MSLKFTWWFGGFAFLIGLLTLIGRINKWHWLFRRIENNDYWEFSHLLRYTIIPFIISGMAVANHFQD